MTIDNSAAIIPLEEYEKLKLFQQAISDRLTVFAYQGYTRMQYFIAEENTALKDLANEIERLNEKISGYDVEKFKILSELRKEARELKDENQILKFQAIKKRFW